MDWAGFPVLVGELDRTERAAMPMAAQAAAAKRCMNAACGAPAPTAAGEWTKGWPLRSGAGFAALCDKCGYAHPLCLPARSLGPRVRGVSFVFGMQWPGG